MKKPIRATGASIDAMHQQFREQMKILKKQIAALTRQGALKAFPHYKAGTTRMYLLEPTDGCGKRPYTYVGGDPKKQKAVLAKIERFYKRESLQSSLDGLERYQTKIEYDLADLTRDFAWAVSQGDNAIKAGEKFSWTWGAIPDGEVTRCGPGPRRGVTQIDEEGEED